MEYFDFVPEGVENCRVTALLQPECDGCAPVRHPVMIFCPGGAYSGLADREGEEAAKKFFAAGYSCFVLRYSVGERARNFEPLKQLAATVAQIRREADRLRIDPDKVAVIGFSAGGHLAASLGVLYDDARFLEAWGRKEHIRPDAVVLCYPVITADKFTHWETIRNVSGGAAEGTPEYTYWGLETHVDGNTPPVFMWHTAEDAAVPVENSLKLSAALSGAKVPFELHVFPQGCHGLSMCTNRVNSPHPYNARWVELCIAWLGKVLDFVD